MTNHITSAMSNPEIISALGQRFKEYRLANRLTQQEAAEKAGVSLITLRQFENGTGLLMFSHVFYLRKLQKDI